MSTPCALLVNIGALGLYELVKTNASLKTVYEDRTVPAVELGQIDALATSSRMQVAQALANPLTDMITFSIKSIPTGFLAGEGVDPRCLE